MTMNDKERLALGGALLELSVPIDELRIKLGAIAWDFEGDGVMLKRRQIASVLQRYLENNLSDAFTQ